MKKIILIVGARPNFMKAYPVYEALKNDFELTLIHTGQHFDAKMSDVFFNQLGFPKPNIHFDLESKSRAGELDNKLYVDNLEYLKDKNKVIDELINYDGNELGQLGEIRDKLIKHFEEIKPDLVIVFGDVTSTLSAALSAKKLGIEIAHVESGLRSGDLTMPEEVNRILTDTMTNYYFITEQSGVDNLKKEGLDNGNLYLVGNTMIDCLFMFKNKALDTKYHEVLGLKEKEYVLITLHRPSNVDNLDKLKEITEDIIKLSELEKIIFPIHPRTKKNLEKLELLDKMNNIIICEPLGYLEFTCLEANAKYVVTDSGGIQEETTALDIPCFTLRENTERPSTLIENGGTNQLIDKIYGVKLIEINNYLNTSDGMVAKRILYYLQDNEKNFQNNRIGISNPYYDFILFNNNKKKLIIFFTGANNKKIHPAVYLPRISYVKSDYFKNNYDMLYIPDPTMKLSWFFDKEIEIGWYMYDILNKDGHIYNFINSLYKNYDNVYFTGSSGGGFAALYYGSLFKNSKIITINPQTNIFLHNSVHINNLKKLLKDFDETRFTFDNIMNNILLNQSSVLYLQNKYDSFHIIKYSQPLENIIINIKFIYFCNNENSIPHNDGPSLSQHFNIIQHFDDIFEIIKNKIIIDKLDELTYSYMNSFSTKLKNYYKKK